MTNFSMSSTFKVPSFFVYFYSRFPLVSYPPIAPLNKKSYSVPTLWILPPRQNNLLSADVECLKWQAYLALRGLTDIKIRWDIAPEGSISGSLPNLHIPSDKEELLAAHAIPAWVDAKLGVDSSADPLEGYVDQAARVESRAWVSLLEGIVHATLVWPATFVLSFYANLCSTDPISTTVFLLTLYSIPFLNTTHQRELEKNTLPAPCFTEWTIFFHPSLWNACVYASNPDIVQGRYCISL